MSDPYKDDDEVRADTGSADNKRAQNERDQAAPAQVPPPPPPQAQAQPPPPAQATATPAAAAAAAQRPKPTREGEVRKFAIARSKFSRHNWKTRYFVLSPANHGIRYYASGPDAGKADDSSEESYDADADPDGDSKPSKGPAAPAAADGRKCKGEVYLDKRSRIITKPSNSIYKLSSADASDELDIGVIFFEGPKATKERRLIFQCKSKKDYADWILALAEYIPTIDDPADYNDKAKKEAPKK